MDIARLREYIVLSRHLNFTAAAKELHLSQPALSNHLQALEREVGTRLAERSTVGEMRLTLAGQRLLEMAKAVVSEYDTAMADLREIRREVVGQIRVRMPRREYSRPLLDYVYEFRAAYPNIEMVLAPWTAEDGHSDVASGKVDCAYIGQVAGKDGFGQTDVPGVLQVVYGEQEGLLWMDAADPLANLPSLSICNIGGRCFAIPANQKNASWISVMSSMATEHAVAIDIDEKYCDSLEDFLMNKVGPGDLVLNYRAMFEMPGIDSRADRLLRSFDPPLNLRFSIAYADRPDDVALQTFVAFLHEKYQESGGMGSKKALGAENLRVP